MSFRKFLAELHRRRVFRVALVYLIVAYAVLQAAQVVFASLSLPDWAFPALVICGIVGFPIALVLGWAFDLLPARPASWGPSDEGGGPEEGTDDGVAREPRAGRGGGEPPDEVSPAPGVVVLALLFALGIAAVAGWCGFLRSENAAEAERSSVSLTSDAPALHLGAVKEGPTGVG